ncbi:class I SAM-dependent methyltransferase [uncultured Acetobacterium sp.]|uniref:class I SAM-dependent methyltransferase n=1 Tax=uncultured Acetobacterium sp. TaxID=217139 RepID=UPI002421C57B|nr:class I SAM-dependent methyltransferase [uncultured Acetobacterium sp.]MBU4541010.1 class I SAM-dependent methyltransferase [Bacillota bacterium]MDP2843889.1 class I SAM-dependent methyltransferase [Acetobacterium sp.]
MGADENYQLNAKFYDVLDRIYFRKPATSPRNAVISILGDEPLRVLDMCTGTGVNAFAIAEARRNTKVIGIDISAAMLQKAAAKLEQEELSNVKLIHMNAANLQFPSEEFDVVLISLVLHELNPDLAGQLIGEARRVLKNTGKLIVVEWEEPVSRFKRIPFYLVKKTESAGFEDFLKTEMEQYFFRFGFEMTQTIHCDYSKVMVLRKNDHI